MAEYIKLEDAIKEAKAWSMYGEDDLLSRLERLPSIDVRNDDNGWHKCTVVVEEDIVSERKEQEEC